MNGNSKFKSEIIGNSPKLLESMGMARKYARSNYTILLNGETGVGKELFAKLIRENSLRSKEPFITVHTAGLPSTLLENELFGHELGAFTDARTQYIGRFERAGKGTIFLDEIGDISPSTQVRLLRVLQEGEFERLGGNKPIPMEARVVAATNQPLEVMVEKGSFRRDLFYRLNVLPIRIPPLRERREDIPLLARYFLLRDWQRNWESAASDYSEQYPYSWPGNIRELEWIITRSAILCEGPITQQFLEKHLPEWCPVQNCAQSDDLVRAISNTAGTHLIGSSSEDLRMLLEKALAHGVAEGLERALEDGLRFNSATDAGKRLGIKSLINAGRPTLPPSDYLTQALKAIGPRKEFPETLNQKIDSIWKGNE